MTSLDQLALPPFNLAPADIEWVRLTRDAMGTEDRLRQLFVLTLNSDDTTLAAERVQFKVGGVLRDWGADFDRAWQTTHIVIEGSEVPPFIAGDLECGGYGFPCMTPLPNPLGVAAMDDLSLSGEVASLLAAEAHAMGFNWSFTPVVDINARLDSTIVGTRSYGSDPERITQQALGHVRALQAQGIAATAKHWPGEGFDFRDQHLVTTVNPLDIDAWRANFGAIYRRLFEAGTLSVMTGHIALPAWVRHRNPGAGREAFAPASVCREINHVLLREVMGFNGLVTSDATSMAGLTSWADRAEAVPQVIQSGCDIFLFSTDAERDLGHMREGLRKGMLTEQRLDDAITRILGLKAKLGLHRLSVDERLLPKAELKERLRQPAAMALADRAASASITLVKDTGVLPLSPHKHRRVVVISAGVENSKPGVSLRAVVSRSKRDGYVDTAHAPANNFAHDRSDTDNTSGRVHALFTFAKDSTLLLSADTSSDEGAGPGTVAYATLAAHPTGDAGRYVANPKYEGRQRNRAGGVSAEFNQGLGSVNLTVQAGHRSQTRNLLYSVADAGSGAFNRTEFSQNSLEARLASDGSGPLQWVAGAFHFDEKGSPVVLQAFGPQLLFIQDPMKTRSSAAFGQATYTVAPGLRATAGLRYTSDTKSRMGCAYPFAALRTAGLNDLVDPNAPLTGAPDQSRLPACPVASINNVPSTHWKQTTYRAGLDYDLDANTLLYASYATGFKAGGFNDGNIATAANISAIIYNPEKLAAFEAGLKGGWLDGRLRLNVSLFSYSYTDLQVTSLTTCSSGIGLCTVTQNAAKASSRGGELEGSFLASDVDRLTFGLGVTNAKYDRFTTSGGADWKGFKLDKSPSTTLNLGYSRQFPLASGAAVTAGISARYSAGYELSNSAANLRFSQSSFHKTDVNLSYDSPDDRLSIQAYVRNIEDRNVATSYQASGGQHGVYLAEPRMVGVRANLKF